MSSEQLLKIGDVSTFLGVTTQTLRNWANRGYIDILLEKEGIEDFQGVKWTGSRN